MDCVAGVCLWRCGVVAEITLTFCHFALCYLHHLTSSSLSVWSRDMNPLDSYLAFNLLPSRIKSIVFGLFTHCTDLSRGTFDIRSRDNNAIFGMVPRFKLAGQFQNNERARRRSWWADSSIKREVSPLDPILGRLGSSALLITAVEECFG